MKEYSRRITGVMRSMCKCCYMNDDPIEELISRMIGSDRDYFPATLSICITDLTEDTGAPADTPAPEERGKD